MIKDKGHYIMIKQATQEDIAITNIYAPNIGAPQYVRQMLTSMKGEINSNTIIMGDFNMPMDRSTIQKISEETQALNDTLDQIYLIISMGHFTSEQWNSTFSQVHMKHSAGYTTSWAIIALVNLK